MGEQLEGARMGEQLAMFRVSGRARTKGSLKAWCTKGPAHKVRLEEQTKDSAAWRRVIALVAQRHQKRFHGKLLGHSGPVEVRVTVWLQRESIPSHQTPFPTDIRIGDVDKLARNICDALTDSWLIRDDSQVTDLMVAKRWTPDDAPGWVEILVQTVPEGVSDVWWLPGGTATDG